MEEWKPVNWMEGKRRTFLLTLLSLVLIASYYFSWGKQKFGDYFQNSNYQTRQHFLEVNRNFRFEMNPKGRMNEWKRVYVCGQQQITDYTSFIHNFFLSFFAERERERRRRIEREKQREKQREKAEEETKITGNLTKHENCTPWKYTYYFEGLCLCVSRVRESTGGKVNEWMRKFEEESEWMNEKVPGRKWMNESWRISLRLTICIFTTVRDWKWDRFFPLPSPVKNACFSSFFLFHFSSLRALHFSSLSILFHFHPCILSPSLLFLTLIFTKSKPCWGWEGQRVELVLFEREKNVLPWVDESTSIFFPSFCCSISFSFFSSSLYLSFCLSHLKFCIWRRRKIREADHAKYVWTTFFPLLPLYATLSLFLPFLKPFPTPFYLLNEDWVGSEWKSVLKIEYINRVREIKRVREREKETRHLNPTLSLSLPLCPFISFLSLSFYQKIPTLEFTFEWNFLVTSGFLSFSFTNGSPVCRKDQMVVKRRERELDSDSKKGKET